MKHLFRLLLLCSLVVLVGCLTPVSLGTLQLSDIQLSPIFPALYDYYAEHPIGTAVLSNSSTIPATNITVSVEIKPYTIAPLKCKVPTRLEPGASAAINLSAAFSGQQLLAVTENERAFVEITWSCEVNGREASGKEIGKTSIYDRNAMTWNDDRMLAAFVTPKDPAVLTLAKSMYYSFQRVRTTNGVVVDPSLRVAIALYEAICLSRIQYVDSGFALKSLRNSGAVDFRQLPWQTLAYKGGDSADIAVLFCSLFEAVGVSTALIVVPDHVFIAFSLDMTPDEARQKLQRPDDMIVRGDTAWLPFEVTNLNGGFHEAWQTGAKEWREYVTGNQASFYLIRDAWKVYKSESLIEPVQITVPGPDDISPAYIRELQRMYPDLTFELGS
jgi:hypothetical protein